MAKAALQTTLARPVTKEGIGLHTGAPAAVSLLPADPHLGLVFVSEAQVEIPARAEFVVDTRRTTTLGRDGAVVSGVEHVLAALWTMGVDNARIAVRSSEVPACDGSAREWVELIRQAGKTRLGAARRVLPLSQPVWVGGESGWSAALPARALSLGVVVEYQGTAAGGQALWLPLTERRFAEELAPARTFCLQQEYEALLASGLARGGSLENAFVVEADGYSGPLRFPDEVVRHKALDLVGDLALCGLRFTGQVIAMRPSHRLNVELARAVQASVGAGAEPAIVRCTTR